MHLHPAWNLNKSLEELEEAGQIPDSPAGRPRMRKEIAIRWEYDPAKEVSREEMATRLGVSVHTINGYFQTQTAHLVEQEAEKQRQSVRQMTIRKLMMQLEKVEVEAGEAEEPVEIWKDDDGDLNVVEETNQDGEVVNRYPVPQGFDMGPDTRTRYYRREEAREILEDLVELTGAGEPVEIEHSGEVKRVHDVDDEVLDELFGE